MIKAYLTSAFATWLTPLYLIVLACITAAVAKNILEEENLTSQIIGGLVLIPLVLRLLLIK